MPIRRCAKPVIAHKPAPSSRLSTISGMRYPYCLVLTRKRMGVDKFSKAFDLVKVTVRWSYTRLIKRRNDRSQSNHDATS
jgi:hypothetical protein